MRASDGASVGANAPCANPVHDAVTSCATNPTPDAPPLQLKRLLKLPSAGPGEWCEESLGAWLMLADIYAGAAGRSKLVRTPGNNAHARPRLPHSPALPFLQSPASPTRPRSPCSAHWRWTRARGARGSTWGASRRRSCATQVRNGADRRVAAARSSTLDSSHPLPRPADAAEAYEKAWRCDGESSAPVGYKLAFNYLKAGALNRRSAAARLLFMTDPPPLPSTGRATAAIDIAKKVLAAYPK